MTKAPLDFLRENVARYKKLIRGEIVDYAPFRLWIEDTFVCWFTKTDPVKYINSFEVMLGAQKAVNERFSDMFDFYVNVDYLDIFFDRDKFLTDFPGALPNRFLEADLGNFDKYYSRKKLRDVPGVKKLAEGIEYYKKNLPPHKQVAHYYGVGGVMDLFSVFRGTENFFTDLYDYPEMVHRIFSYITERSLEWLAFIKENWGDTGEYNMLYDKLDIGEDYCAYLPPKLFDEFELPYTGKLIKEAKGVLKSLHSDGDFHTENLAKLKELGVEEFMGFTPNMDIREVRRVLPDVILAGNIHPINVMNFGTPDDVKAAAEYCFRNASQNQKFVLCTGGAIGAGAKPENIDAFLDAAYQIVKY